MIYSIISNNDIPVTQMHTYLKNETNDDGGNIPEIFNDLALSESVNGLYAFAIACLVTDNFTKQSSLFTNDEVSILNFIQYLKGMATTIQRKHKTDNKLYDNLVNTNLIGTAPTILNLDGDLFKNHYDTNKYHSREAADAAEDSFPYWVINIIKKIKDVQPIIKPEKNVKYELPYYIQNISNGDIEIIDKDKNVIGKIPPSGTEPVSEINNGIARLMTVPRQNAFVVLNETKLVPCKHLVSEDELKPKNLLQIPDDDLFYLKAKSNIKYRKGINKHYLSTENKIKKNTVIEVDKAHVFLDSYYITDDLGVIPITSNYFTIYNKPEPKIEEKTTHEEHTNSVSKKKKPGKYKVIVDISKTKYDGHGDLVTAKLHSKVLIDLNYLLDNNTKYNKIVCGDFDDEKSAIALKKKIIALTGFKATIE